MTFDQLSGQAVRASRIILAGILCAALLLYGYRSIHWQVTWDPSIMHYVNFLMDHGLAPYRDIVDINLPGSYFMDRVAMFVFGGGDLGWRIYEFCLLGVMAGAMIVISLPYDWFAGFCAFALFTLTHAVEGTRNAGQREELMTVLILVGYAFLFHALRRRQPMFMLFFGISLGLATSLKPTAALLVVVLPAMAVLSLRKHGLRSRAYLTYAAIGFAVALLVNVWFFWHYHVFHDFIAVSKRLVAYYARIGNDPASVLVHTLLKKRDAGLLLAGGALTYLNARRTTWENMERNMLFAGVLFGAISYLAQRKDFEHHLYTYLALLLLWATIEFAKAWTSPGWQRVAALAIFTVLVLYRVRNYPALLTTNQPMQEQEIALRNDFQRLGGAAALQHEILCFDVVSGCYSALYHEQILPYSNLVADYMLFPPAGNAPVTYYREMLWNDLQRRAPKVVVVTDMWLCSAFSFNKIKQWPAIIHYLEMNYDMSSSVKSGFGTYRLYVRKPAVPAESPRKVPTT